MPNHGMAHPPAASVRHYFTLPSQRPARVRVKAQDLKGKTFTMSLKCVAGGGVGGMGGAWQMHGLPGPAVCVSRMACPSSMLGLHFAAVPACLLNSPPHSPS